MTKHLRQRNRIGEILKERGWNAANLAERAGIGRGVAYKYATNPFHPARPNTIIKIANALNLEPHEFIWWESVEAEDSVQKSLDNLKPPADKTTGG